MIYYAKLNENGVCCEIKGVKEELVLANHIQLDSEDYNVLNKRYKNGIWEDVPPPEPPAPEPTEQETLQAEILLNQQQIIGKQKEIDMTLAELLLNQQGVDR